MFLKRRKLVAGRDSCATVIVWLCSGQGGSLFTLRSVGHCLTREEVMVWLYKLASVWETASYSRSGVAIQLEYSR